MRNAIQWFAKSASRPLVVLLVIVVLVPMTWVLVRGGEGAPRVEISPGVEAGSAVPAQATVAPAPALTLSTKDLPASTPAGPALSQPGAPEVVVPGEPVPPPAPQPPGQQVRGQRGPAVPSGVLVGGGQGLQVRGNQGAGVQFGGYQGFRVDGARGARVQFGGGQGVRINGRWGGGIQLGGGRGVVIGDVGTE